MDALPNLQIIACYGVGVDAIDLAHARRRGIRVTDTPDVLADDVADMAGKQATPGWFQSFPWGYAVRAH